MKATRYEYMKEMEKFLQTHEYATESVLEISGKTEEWLKYFDNATTTKFPEVSADNLPYEDASFDCVIMNQVLEHCKQPWECVKETYRVLRKGGICILSSPFFYQVHNHPGDFFRFTPEGLLCLTEYAGYETVLLSHRSGNTEMVKHVMEYPSDRNSYEFMRLAKNKRLNKSLYFLISTVVVSK